jgi:hypothetical protein
MATIKMMQGDSRAIFFTLEQSGTELTPNKLSEVEITVGTKIRKLYSTGEVKWDKSRRQWYIFPSQEETLALEPDGYEVQARYKFPNGEFSPVKGLTLGRIAISSSQSKDVI